MSGELGHGQPVVEACQADPEAEEEQGEEEGLGVVVPVVVVELRQGLDHRRSIAEEDGQHLQHLANVALPFWSCTECLWRPD